MMNASRRAILTFGCLTSAALAAGFGPVSCKSETAGEEISFSAALGGTTSAGQPLAEQFTTYSGWTVRLTRAMAAIGPVYYYGGEPEAHWFDGLLGIRTAVACPTHAQYDKGPVLGEVVQQYAVDLLAPVINLGTLSGFKGDCRSVELHLHPPGKLPAAPGSPSFSELDGENILVEGTASRGALERSFRAHLTLPDEGLLRVVESIPASVPLRDGAENPGSILVEVLVDQWLASVDFETLTKQEGETWVFTEETQAWTAFVRGVRSKQSYRVSWRSE